MDRIETTTVDRADPDGDCLAEDFRLFYCPGRLDFGVGDR
jgi:hypothetical protein